MVASGVTCMSDNVGMDALVLPHLKGKSAPAFQVVHL